MPWPAGNAGTMRSRSMKLLSTLLLSLLLIGSIHSQDPVETVRIESDLVDLKVSVLGFSSDADAALLDQKDFEVLEDGAKQEIAFFAAADVPFDLLLLLDVSGSASGKLKLIRNSAKRFVDAARPVDRLAIMTFTDQPYLLSKFSLDRRQLKKDIGYIDDAYGGTNFWDSLNDVLTNMVRNQSRRTAIVVMTDGVDNALPGVKGEGSQTTFETLIENVRRSEALVFPLYLDTEKKNEKNPEIPHDAYVIAHEQLSQIASSSGTTLYHAARLQDLDNVYAQVIRDLGRIYSIGYKPSNRALDGKWRQVEVHLVGRPNLQARTRRGYYAKQAAASDTEKK